MPSPANSTKSHLSDLFFIFQIGGADLQGLWLELEPLVLQELTPRFLDLGKPTWHIRLREEGSLTHPLRLNENVEAAVGILSEEGSFVGNVVFADLLCLFSQKFEALPVAIARVKQQEAVEIVTLLIAGLSQGQLADSQANIANFLPLFG